MAIKTKFKLLYLITVLSFGIIFAVSAQSEFIRIITAQRNVNVRESASTSVSSIGSLGMGESAVVIGEDANGETVSGISLWYQVRLANGTEGWVWSGAITLSEVTPTPSPTPRPTLPPNPDYETITTENASDIQPLYEWGRGIPNRIAWSADGERLLVASRSGLWVYHTAQFEEPELTISTGLGDSQTLFAQVGFVGNTSNIYYVAYLTGEETSVIQLTNLENHQQGATIPLNNILDGGALRGNRAGKSEIVALSPDGHTFAIADPAGVRFVTLEYTSSTATILNSEEQSPLDLPFQPNIVSFSPDGNRLAVSGGNTTHLYSFPALELIATVRLDGAPFFSADGSILALMGASGFFNTFTFFNTIDGTQRQTIQIPFGIADAKIPSQGGLLVASYENSASGVRFFNIENGSEIQPILSESGYSEIAYNPNETRLAGVSDETGFITIWDTSTGEILYTHHYSSRLTGIMFDATGTIMATKGRNQVIFRNVQDQNGTPQGLLVMPQWTLFGSATLDPNGQRLFATGSMSVGSGWETVMQMVDGEGQPLSEEYHFNNISLYGGSTSPFSEIAFSPDGQTLVFGRHNSAIEFRDPETLEIRSTVHQDCCSVQIIRFSADGRYFVSGGDNNDIVRVWTAAGQSVTSLNIPSSTGTHHRMFNLTISDDGQRVAAAYNDAAYVWDVSTGEILWESNQQRTLVKNIALSPDGQLIATYQIIVDQGLQMFIYDLNAGRLLRYFPVNILDHLQFTPDGSLLVAYQTEDGIIRFWGVPREVQPIETPTATPTPTSPPTMTVTPIPTSTPALLPNSTAETISTENAQELQPIYQWAKGVPLKVAWSSDGKQFIVASTTGLWLYDAENLDVEARQVYRFNTDQLAYTFVGQIGFIGDTSNIYYLAEIRPPSQWNVTTIVQIINIENGQEGATIGLSIRSPEISIGHASQLVSLSPDSRTFAIADRQGIRIIDLRYDSPNETITRIHERETIPLDEPPSSLAFSPDGSQIAVNAGTQVEIYTFPEFDLSISTVSTTNPLTPVTTLLFSPNGKTLTILGTGVFFFVIDTETGAELTRYATNLTVSDAVINPNGAYFAVTYNRIPYGIRFYDTAQDIEMDYLPDTANYSGLAFNPDGTLLVGVGNNIGKLALWDTQTKETIFTDDYVGRDWSIQLDAAGELLALSGGGQTSFYAVRDETGTISSQLTIPQWTSLGETILAPDGDRLFAIGQNPIGSNWEWETVMQMVSREGVPLSDETISTGDIHSGQVVSRGFSADGEFILLGRRDGGIEFLDVETLQPLRTSFQNCCSVQHLVTDIAGQYFISAGEEDALYVWAYDGQRIQRLPLPQSQNGISDIAISADGTTTAETNFNTVSVWDTKSGTLIGEFIPPTSADITTAGIRAIALNPNGSLLAVGAINLGQLFVFNVESNTLISTLPFTSELLQLRFTPDGTLLIGNGQDGVIRFWGVQREVQPTVTPTASATPTVTPTMTATATLTPTATWTPTFTLTPTPAPLVLFQDDFEDGNLDEWGNWEGVGQIVDDNGNHILRLENNTDAFSVFSLVNYHGSDYAVEARVRIEQSSLDQTDFFLNVRENERGGYGTALDVEGSGTGILAGVDGNYTDLGTEPLALPMNEWLLLKVQVVGEQMNVYINGELIVSATHSAHREGGVSLTVGPHTIVEVDDIAVIEQ